MASEALPRIWHLCPTEPTTRIPAPPSTELFIGAIIRSKLLKDLRVPLNRFERPNIPSNWIKQAGPQKTSHRVKESKGTSGGFFTTIAKLIGLGPQASVSYAEETDVTYNFEEEWDMWLDVPLEERRADVDDSASVSFSLCEDAVAASATVQKFRDESGWRKPVYMVTGIKWVSGISISLGSGHKVCGKAAVEADLSAVTGVPATIGVQGTGSRETLKVHVAKGGMPFIFCVKLTKVKWDRTGYLIIEDMRKGTYMNIGKAEDDDEQMSAPPLVASDATAQDFDDSEAITLVDVNTGLEEEFLYDIE
ncbi:uncharacterized protein A1O5_10995 [Cladophialophora psammophila CBS 110553]|uniref:Uncharacterized protein n=1 Tax=Cladophialophora psammophila CBS 110553 TaxID=1182543 RepID=W9WDL1_9EURO|nr:uncharacterized protein A1O5_10995 [Cladophialophora psammophila CBS 110553]EXJ66018.1 hypothetical protein A1O5_10995 [Cladophialophora psammophila CBS 110553]